MSERLGVAIAHYHLHTGGVTTVIRHACAALRAVDVDVVILTGMPVADKSAWDVPVRIIEGLGYDEGRDIENPSRLADALAAAARDALGRPADLFHVHNHNLGKNIALPFALRMLADRGVRLLLQMHDFAEDGRPENYRRVTDFAARSSPSPDEALYPLAPHVHLAVLNGRDHEYLLAAGCDPARLHLLPNAVTAPAVANETEPPALSNQGGGRLFIYPTRAIRRKNLGELLLWAAASPDDRFAVTLAPKNPRYHDMYRHWVSLAERLKLPVEFELGAKSELPFGDLLQTADALITTSVAEGFGLVYLEPWLIGRPLVGRRLPLICRDIEAQGVRLGGLYDGMTAPVNWLRDEAGDGTLERRVGDKLRATFEAYGRACDDDLVRRVVDSLIVNDRVDVGRLDESLQSVIIERVRASPAARRELQPVRLTLDAKADRATIEHNRKIARNAFGLPRYGQRLLDAYVAVMREDPGDFEPLSAAAVLDAFLKPESFNLLLT